MNVIFKEDIEEYNPMKYRSIIQNLAEKKEEIELLKMKIGAKENYILPQIFDVALGFSVPENAHIYILIDNECVFSMSVSENQYNHMLNGKHRILMMKTSSKIQIVPSISCDIDVYFGMLPCESRKKLCFPLNGNFNSGVIGFATEPDIHNEFLVFWSNLWSKSKGALQCDHVFLPSFIHCKSLKKNWAQGSMLTPSVEEMMTQWIRTL